MIREDAMKNTGKGAGDLRVLRKGTLALSALLFFGSGSWTGGESVMAAGIVDWINAAAEKAAQAENSAGVSEPATEQVSSDVQKYEGMDDVPDEPESGSTQEAKTEPSTETEEQTLTINTSAPAQAFSEDPAEAFTEDPAEAFTEDPVEDFAEDPAQVFPEAEEEELWWEEAQEALGRRLALLGQLQSETPQEEGLQLWDLPALYSERTLENLRGIVAPEDLESAWVFTEDPDTSLHVEEAFSGDEADVEEALSEDEADVEEALSEDEADVEEAFSGDEAYAEAKHYVEEAGAGADKSQNMHFRWGVHLRMDGTASLYIRQLSGEYEDVTITVPEKVGILTVTEIEDGCFTGMREKLRKVTLPDTIRTIGAEAFAGCSALRSINLPAALEQIGERAFDGTDIRWFAVPEENTAFESREGVLYQKDTATLAVYPAGNRREEYAIPEGTTGVAPGAFAGNTYLRRCTVPASMKEIEAGVFAGSAIEQLSVAPEHTAFESVSGVLYRRSSSSYPVKVLAVYPPGKKQARYVVRRTTRSIADGAFAGNPYLEQVFLPDGLVQIGKSAFAGCSALTRIALPESVLTLGNYAFGGCERLEEVQLSPSLDILDEDVFAGCAALQNVEISESTEVVGKEEEWLKNIPTAQKQQ